ncbi:hypothetical protein ACWCPF_27380 [Streptomyces sp. NPDC001858]
MGLRAEQLRLSGLTTLQAESLTRSIGSDSTVQIRSADGELKAEQHGDQSLVEALIQIGPPAVAAISVWLAKNRNRLSHHTSLHIKHPDGTEIEYKVSTLKKSSSGTGVELPPEITGLL